MFLMTSILAGMGLAALPILIHMLRKQNVIPLDWGAMQFLLETPLRARRRRSIDNWLLLLIRMAILALLALALARPLLRGNSFVTTTPVDVAVVIDHSLSMGRRTGNLTLFDQGITELDKLRDMLPPSASISIILAEHAPRALTPVPLLLSKADKSASDWATTLQQLHQLPPGMTAADIPLAIQSATEVVNRGHNLRKLILIISDQQRSNWSIGSESAWHSARSGVRDPSSLPIYALQIPATESTPNVAVGNIAVQPAFLGIHRPAQITATLSNTGSSDLANIPVQFLVDGRLIATQQIASLSPGKSNTVHFDHYFTEAGSHWVRIKADLVDGLEADNAATASVNISPRLPVLLIDGQLTSSRNYPAAEYLLIAMQPIDPTIDPGTLIDPKIISVADIDSVRLDDYPVIILNDVPRLTAATLTRLTNYIQKGNGLWIILGRRSRDTFLNSTLAKSPLFPATVNPIKTITAPNTPVTIDIKDPDNPTVALVTAAQRNALAGATVSAWWPLKSADPSMHTILATTDNPSDPLATEMPLGSNGGRVILWTTSASDPQWNNLPLVPNFTPLVQETILHLASSQMKSQSRDLDAGQPLLWSGPASLAIQSATLLTPDKPQQTLQPELRGDQYFLNYKETHTAGLYELHFTPPTAPQPIFFTVNTDKAELDPATLSTTDFDWLKTGNYVRENLSLATLPHALNAQVGGLELWPLTILFVLALLIAEAILTYRLLKKQSAIDVENAGLITNNPHPLLQGGGPTQ